MEYTGPPPIILLAASLVVASALVFVLFRIMRAAKLPVSDTVTQARRRRVNVCFVLFGSCVLAVLWGSGQPEQSQQAALTFVAMFFGVPLTLIAGPIVLYNSALLWRDFTVRVLWIISLLSVLLVSTLEEQMGTSLATNFALTYALVIIALAIRGLITGRRTHPE